MEKTTNLNKVKKNPRRYTWGDVVKIHEIGEYSIIEFTWGNFGDDEGRLGFSPYVNGEDFNESFDTLDEALAAAIAYKNTGGSRAGEYFMKMLK